MAGDATNGDAKEATGFTCVRNVPERAGARDDANADRCVRDVTELNEGVDSKDSELATPWKVKGRLAEAIIGDEHALSLRPFQALTSSFFPRSPKLALPQHACLSVAPSCRLAAIPFITPTPRWPATG